MNTRSKELKGWIYTLAIFAVLFFLSFRYHDYLQEEEIEAIIQEEEMVYKQLALVNDLIVDKEYAAAFHHLDHCIGSMPFRMYPEFEQIKKELTHHLHSWAEQAIAAGDTNTYYDYSWVLYEEKIVPKEEAEQVLLARLALDHTNYPLAIALTKDLAYGPYLFSSSIIYARANREMDNDKAADERLFAIAHKIESVRRKVASMAQEGTLPPALSPEGHWKDASDVSAYFLEKEELNKALDFAQLAEAIAPNQSAVYLLQGDIYHTWETVGSPCPAWRKAKDLGSTEAQARLRTHCR